MKQYSFSKGEYFNNPSGPCQAVQKRGRPFRQWSREDVFKIWKPNTPENASGFDSLFLIFLKSSWIKMQHDVKDCLHYYPACNLQRNMHIAPSKNAMERCGLARRCGLEFTPAHSMKCVIAEKSSRSHAVFFD
jgi:hypothetical protein